MAKNYNNCLGGALLVYAIAVLDVSGSIPGSDHILFLYDLQTLGRVYVFHMYNVYVLSK